ncbi:MAG: enoyl-CoA hydratase/isomerase family protein [Betaproteobacteria bacterium]|nr:enoyl-CoA hydratase/isomerase family protein [Betaproteobacteria bacterium]
MSEQTVRVAVTPPGVATVTMCRPDVHNAFDDALIAELTRALRSVDELATARVVVLAAEGRSFSAGADLNWMKRMAHYSEGENLRDALHLAELLRTLDRMRKPTIARVQGAAFGGGVGLVAACDMAVCAAGAQFSLSEVRLGLIPAVISPYVVQAIGARAARRYFLTAERFAADEACRLGLVNEVVEPAALDEAVERFVSHLLKGGPHAIAAAKDLVRSVADRPIETALIEDTAQRIASIRASAEGREGIAAFLDKRTPAWMDGTEQPE